MMVELMTRTPIKNVIIGARTCYDSFDRYDYVSEDSVGENNKKLLKNLIRLGHLSVFEHLVYTFNIEGISRLCLMEITRHRIASYSVQSTRYTLKRFLTKFREIEDPFQAVREFCVFPKHFSKDDVLKLFSIIENLYELKDKFKNDELKYYLPECWKTNLIMTINFRSFLNFFELRSSEKAHFEIRELVNKMFSCLPQIDQDLIKTYIKQKEV